MKKSLLLTIAICLGIYTSGQQWEVITETPSANLSNGLTIHEDGLHGMAAGENLLLITSNGGENWETATPIPEGGPNKIFMLTADSVWAVFASGMIYATSDGGQTWVNQSSGTTRRLFDVQFIDHITGWAVGGWQDGSPYLVLRTTNGGQTWENQSFGSASNPTIQAVSFIDAQTGWICGKADGEPFIQKTEDGGASWVNQELPVFTGTGKSCGDIGFASADIGWATTDRNNQEGEVIYTADGGTTWNIQTTTACDQNNLDVQDAQHVAIMCRDQGSTGQKIVKITTDGGITWITNTSPTFSYNISYVGSSIWIGAETARILHSSDFGANWDYQFQSYYLQSVDWIDNNSAWIVSKFLDPTGFALRTDDGGSNWFEDEDTPSGNYVFVLDENTAWIMIQGSPLTEPAILNRTTDGGANWATSTLPAGYIDGFTWVTADLGWAFGGSGNIRHTTDGGVTWVAQNMNTPNYIADIHFINPLEGWACGYYGSENAFIRHTVDGGVTWTIQNPVNITSVKDIHFFDSLNGVVVGNEGQVQSTTDGGNTWSIISTIPGQDLELLVMLNETTGWATGESIYRTDDGGQSWTQEWSPTPVGGEIISMAFNPEKSSLLACGSSNTILKYQILAADFEADVTSIIEGEIVFFTDLSFGEVTEWFWEFEGGTPATSAEQNPIVMYELEGEYDVTLTISDGTNSGTLIKEDYITVEHIININNNQINEVCIYPNPSDKRVFIETRSELEKIQLLSLAGQLILDQTIKAKKLELNTSFIKSGIYIIKVYTHDKIIMRKLLIE